jgi:hypothetical protein
MIIDKNIPRLGVSAIPIPQEVVIALVKNNREIRGRRTDKIKKSFQKIDSTTNQAGNFTNDSAYASFPFKDINKWIQAASLGTISMIDLNGNPVNLNNLELKISFGSYYDNEDKSDVPTNRMTPTGKPIFSVHPSLKEIANFDLPDGYLGQQTAILSIVQKTMVEGVTKVEENFKAILLAAGDSLDVARLCPPEYS